MEIDFKVVGRPCRLRAKGNGIRLERLYRDRIIEISHRCIARKGRPGKGEVFYGDSKMNINDIKRPILLVEDDPMDVDLTRRAFARSKLLNPFEVARDGEEALACMSRWEEGETPPVVILLDLKLPKIDGLEVLSRIKNHSRFRTIPVVVITSSGEERDIQGAYRLGANSYIVKSMNFEHFVKIAEQIEIYWTVFNTPPR